MAFRMQVVWVQGRGYAGWGQWRGLTVIYKTKTDRYNETTDARPFEEFRKDTHESEICVLGLESRAHR